jgi:hypothetical protein
MCIIKDLYFPNLNTANFFKEADFQIINYDLAINFNNYNICHDEYVGDICLYCCKMD